MATRLFLVATLLLSCLAATSHGEILFSSLKSSLLVSASHRQGVLKAGEGDITLTWSYKSSNLAGTDSTYKTVKLKLCYAPISQKDRAWRRTEDHLKKDKTCQFDIVTKPYKSANNNFTWTIERDVPTGTYFVRAYALNSAGEESGYGQNTNAEKTDDLFEVQAISGRHATLDICSVVFSVFSVVSLFGFFYMEKRKAKASQHK
ncbi:high-affinity nitrate transporter 3.2-like [Nicotiana tabacum]|uniref:High-affinity nitrate transporter n=2 Tax=Nicotiana TaxID=4085 RepID=A0A1S4B3S1_TOBAC|nr:PREDICTED: high-affinity nitrate transporter 3.2-like [Nicotiana sylvestris]XP_016483580.1 PREDICTED: high-affinity nitrate transporter 3.2-like [Nicotiana tabacum]